MRKDKTNKLEEAAKIIRQESGRIDVCRAEVSDAWEGESAEIFVGKMNLISEQLQKVAMELDEVAEIIEEHYTK